MLRYIAVPLLAGLAWLLGQPLVPGILANRIYRSQTAEKLTELINTDSKAIRSSLQDINELGKLDQATRSEGKRDAVKYDGMRKIWEVYASASRVARFYKEGFRFMGSCVGGKEHVTQGMQYAQQLMQADDVTEKQVKSPKFWQQGGVLVKMLTLACKEEKILGEAGQTCPVPTPNSMKQCKKNGLLLGNPDDEAYSSMCAAYLATQMKQGIYMMQCSQDTLGVTLPIGGPLGASTSDLGITHVSTSGLVGPITKGSVASKKGLQAGWTMVAIDGAPFSAASFTSSQREGEPSTIMFSTIVALDSKLSQLQDEQRKALFGNSQVNPLYEE